MFAEKKFFATAVCPREKQKPHRIHRCGDFNKYRRVVKYLPTPVLSEQVRRVRENSHLSRHLHASRPTPAKIAAPLIYSIVALFSAWNRLYDKKSLLSRGKV